MEALDHFSIPVSGLRSGLHEYDFRIDQAFFQHFEGSPLQDANVNVHLLFDKHPDMYVMTFQISGTVKTTCDRCLEEFDLPIEDDQTLLVKFDEKESEDTDIIYILKGTQMLNVARYIYEFVNLAVPIVKHHEDAGESCNPEMLKYLEQESGEDETPAPNPVWEALKGMNREN